MSTFQTDALNPSALPSSSLGRRRGASARSAFDLSGDVVVNTPEAIRDRFHEEWNVRIDKEVKAVAGGLKDLVELADIGTDPSPHTPLPKSLHLRLRTAQLVRATQNLRDMAHELRLMLLLSGEGDTARRRDAETKLVREDVKQARKDVVKAAAEALGPTAIDLDIDAIGQSLAYGANGSVVAEPVVDLGSGVKAAHDMVDDDDEEEDFEEV